MSTYHNAGDIVAANRSAKALTIAYAAQAAGITAEQFSTMPPAARTAWIAAHTRYSGAGALTILLACSYLDAGRRVAERQAALTDDDPFDGLD